MNVAAGVLTFREGLEAALIIAIVLTYLRRAARLLRRGDAALRGARVRRSGGAATARRAGVGHRRVAARRRGARRHPVGAGWLHGASVADAGDRLRRLLRRRGGGAGVA